MMLPRGDALRTVILTLFWTIRCTASLNNGGSGGLDPMALYKFTNEHCQKQVIPNQVTSTATANLPPFLRNDKTITCSLGLGMQPTQTMTGLKSKLDSTSTVSMLGTSSNNTELLRRLRKDKNGLSLELWIKPLGNITENDAATLFPIFVIGTNHPSSNKIVDQTLCDDQSLDLYLGQRNNILELTYRNSDTVFLPCQRYPLFSFPLTQDQITHVVITLSEQIGQQVFVNGQGSAILRDPFRNTFPNWSEQYNMHFFSHMEPPQGGSGTPSVTNNVWQGQVYQLTIYSGVLTELQVQESLAAGLPPSAPFAFSHSIVVNEDAELVPGSHAASWYNNTNAQNIIPGHVQVVQLEVGSVSAEVDDLLRSLHIPPSNKPASTPLSHQSSSSSSYCYITRLPSRGQLYQLSDTNYVPVIWKNSTSPFDAVLIHSNASVVFMPLAHEYSNPPGHVYGTFDYCVTTSEIIDSRQCQTATISVVVKSVNDPPLPMVLPSPWAVVTEGVRWDGEEIASRFDLQPRPVIQLFGKDVDHNSSITHIRITDPPRWGRLLLSVATFRQDGLMDGTDIKTVNYSFAVPGFVEYVYDTPVENTKVVKGDSSIVDSFQFQVADDHKLWSIPMTVSIEVVSAVTIIPGEEIMTRESTRSLILLNGNDTSGWRRPVGFFIESTPREGKLVDPATGQTLRGGSILSARIEFPYSSGIQVLYIPNDFVCADRKSQNVFHFSYRAIAFRADGRMASVSKAATQSLRLQCIIHPLDFETFDRSTVYRIETIARDSLVDQDPCSGYLYNASQTPPNICSSTAAVLQGIKVSSQDVRDLEKALVSISSQTGSGRVTLNRNYWMLLDLVGGREEMSSSITFWAYPRYLDSILSFLHYQSDTVGQDYILIYIAYGNNCTAPNGLGADPSGVVGNVLDTTTFPHCGLWTQSIPIIVVEVKHAPGKYLIHGFPWYIVPILLGFSALIKAKLTLKAIITTEIKSYLSGRRQKKVEPETTLWIHRFDTVSGKKSYNKDTGEVPLVFRGNEASTLCLSRKDADRTELLTLSSSK